MSRVVVCFPSANPELAARALEVWRRMGYLSVVLANGPAYKVPIPLADRQIDERVYPGWGNGVNIAARAAIEEFDARWIVGAADDLEPDPNLTADEIAAQCEEHFKGTMGVVQPTGDGWPLDKIKVICGSPWIGRNFMLRWNGGRGAFWPEYHHNYADEELCAVSTMHGLLWQRDDLCHKHRHYLREYRPVPEYMRPAYAKHFVDERLFIMRRRNGYPAHCPLP